MLGAENFAYWVLGSKRVREVDRHWPRVGSAFHHAIGFGPLHIEDETELIEVDRPRRLVMKAGMGPAGSATVRLLLEPLGRRRTRVVMEEDPESGITTKLPQRLLHRLVGIRNAGSLRRLARLVEKPESVSSRRRQVRPD